MLLAFHFIEINRIVHLHLKDFVKIQNNGIDGEVAIQEFDTVGEGIERKNLNSFDHRGFF